jgi:transposase
VGADQEPVAWARRLCRGDRGGQSRFVEAVLYRYRTGMPWRDLPERFGDGTRVHLRFSRWATSGVWERVIQHLAADADNEYAMIDSTIVRADQHSAGAQKKPVRTRRSGTRAAG